MSAIRVAVETQFALRRPTGVGIYAARVVEALRRRSDVEVVELCDPSLDIWRFDRRIWWDQMRAPRLARAANADVYHFTAGTMPWRSPRPAVVTLHDLVWLRGANRGRAYVRWYFGRTVPRLVRRADAIVVDTRAARRDVAAGLGIDASRVAVAGAGVDAMYFSLERRPANQPTLLAVGTVEERKDLITAVRALARIAGARLVVAGGRTPYVERVKAEADRLSVADRVEFRGYVPENELARLYESASALVFPSRYEGFGLPLLESMAAGLPVAAARTPVTEEVVGDAAWLFVPGDADALAGAIEEILAGGDAVDERVARARARAKPMTWGDVAAKLMAVYRSVLLSS